jgi:hypothetical protein
MFFLLLELFLIFTAPLMLNITEETEASISDDEFIVNSADIDFTWDTFETSKSDTKTQMIIRHTYVNNPRNIYDWNFCVHLKQKS